MIDGRCNMKSRLFTISRQALGVARGKRGAASGRGNIASKLGETASRPEVLGPALTLLAGFNVIALFWPGGALGIPWSQALHLIFGWGAYLTPLGLAALAAAVISNHLRGTGPISRRVTLGWLIVFVAVECLLDASVGGRQPAWGDIIGGGYLGWLLVEGLYLAVGDVGALAITGVLAAIGLYLGSGVTRGHLSRFAVEAWRQLLAELRRPTGPDIPKFAVNGAGRHNGRKTAQRAGAKKPATEGLPYTIGRNEEPPVAAVKSAGTETTNRPQEGWQLPPLTMLAESAAGELSQDEIEQKVKRLEESLADFHVIARVVEVNPGPTVTQFGLEPGFRERRDRNGKVVKRDKVKVSEVTSLSNDLALSLAAPSIRIEAPVPGRHIIGIEIPNTTTSVVSIRQLVESTAFQKLRSKGKLPIALGEDVSGMPVVTDLTRMPHLLVAGATGSGKSVCMNSIITCLLLQKTPNELRLILVDPKRVELIDYNGVPHLLRPVVVETDKVVPVLKWVVKEMEDRYKKFEIAGVRNIDSYNNLNVSRPSLEKLPYIVVVIDELADMMMQAPEETERLICRLAQLARATGIHLIVATQRPSVDVITGLIKANFPTRISFAVTSQVDSRTILDSVGAEKLLGSGDMLFLPTNAAKPVRVQGAFVDEEVKTITDFWRQQGPSDYADQLVNVKSYSPNDLSEKDDIYEQVLAMTRQQGRISASQLQRRFRIGYSRAARLLDELEAEGVIGPPDSGKSRSVLLTEEAESSDEDSEESSENHVEARPALS